MALITQLPQTPFPQGATDEQLRERGWSILPNGTMEIGLPGTDYHRSYIVQAMPLARARLHCPGAPASAWSLEDNHGGDSTHNTRDEALAIAEEWLAHRQQWCKDDIAGEFSVPDTYLSGIPMPF